MKWYEGILIVAAAALIYDHLRRGSRPGPAAAGSARQGIGSREATLRAYRKAVEVAPNDAGAHRGMAQALYELGRYDEALASFGRAAELDSEAETDIGRGMANLRLRRGGEALESLDRALSRRPADANLHYSRGCALAMLAGEGKPEDAQARYAEAIASFERALRLDRHHADASMARDHVRKRLAPVSAGAAQ